MGAIKSFDDLVVYQRARTLVCQIYQMTRRKPISNDFGLKDQILRASRSMIFNISEGFERDGDKEFIQFLSHSKGSCGELRSQLQHVRDLGYITEEEFERLHKDAIEIGRMMGGLINYLKSSELKGKSSFATQISLNCEVGSDL